MPDQQVLQLIEATFERVALGYQLWFVAYLVLGILSVALPGLAAMNAFPRASRYLAGSGALAAAVFAFVQPHEYATGFDAAMQMTRKTRLAYTTGQIQTDQVVAELKQAIDVTTFRYGDLERTE